MKTSSYQQWVLLFQQVATLRTTLVTLVDDIREIRNLLTDSSLTTVMGRELEGKGEMSSTESRRFYRNDDDWTDLLMFDPDKKIITRKAASLAREMADVRARSTLDATHDAITEYIKRSVDTRLDKALKVTQKSITELLEILTGKNS